MLKKALTHKAHLYLISSSKEIKSGLSSLKTNSFLALQIDHKTDGTWVPSKLSPPSYNCS